MQKNKRIVIGVDIDDTLSASAPIFVKYSNDNWGTSLKVSDYTEDWASMWDVGYDEVRRRADEYLRSGVLLDYDPMPNTHEVLRDLCDDYKIISVSARNTICRTDTISWLEKHFGDIFHEANLHLTGAWDKVTENSINHTKGQICKELGVDILIDDQLKHCLGASEVGINSILFGEYNWNQFDKLPENVTRAKNWLEVSDIIKKFYG